MAIYVMVTGHRKVGEKYYNRENISSDWAWVRGKLVAIVRKLKEKRDITAVSGMALGADQMYTEVCLQEGVPVLAAVPFKGQESKWPQSSQETYQALIKRCEVVIVSEGSYEVAKMQIRNQYMVDKSRACIAVWDGSSGGTANAVRSGRKKGIPIYHINPKLKKCWWEKPEKDDKPTTGDGIDHINIYSKGETELGRYLSNFTEASFECEDGIFSSIEGYWYWLGSRDDNLRTLSGYRAKEYGRQTNKLVKLDPEEFQKKIKKAMRIKLLGAPERILQTFATTTLPFKHYYAFNGITKDAGFKWITDEWERLRKEARTNSQ